jgi:hypothetical protein
MPVKRRDSRSLFGWAMLVSRVDLPSPDHSPGRLSTRTGLIKSLTPHSNSLPGSSIHFFCASVEYPAAKEMVTQSQALIHRTVQYEPPLESGPRSQKGAGWSVSRLSLDGPLWNQSCRGSQCRRIDDQCKTLLSTTSRTRALGSSGIATVTPLHHRKRPASHETRQVACCPPSLSHPQLERTGLVTGWRGPLYFHRCTRPPMPILNVTEGMLLGHSILSRQNHSILLRLACVTG